RGDTGRRRAARCADLAPRPDLRPRAALNSSFYKGLAASRGGGCRARNLRHPGHETRRVGKPRLRAAHRARSCQPPGRHLRALPSAARFLDPGRLAPAQASADRGARRAHRHRYRDLSGARAGADRARVRRDRGRVARLHLLAARRARGAHRANVRPAPPLAPVSLRHSHVILPPRCGRVTLPDPPPGRGCATVEAMSERTKRRNPATGFDLRRMGPGGRQRGETKASYAEAMKKPVPASIESLFQRYPSLAGFSVRGLQDVPDHCSRSGDEDELFVSDVGILPSLAHDDSGEIFEDIAATLAELLAEHPEASELICGRTFARTLH